MLKRVKSLRKTIQQLDGGFFEKFSSHRRTIQDGEEQQKEPTAKLAPIINAIPEVEGDEEEVPTTKRGAASNPDSDTENEEEDTTDFGWNTDELYAKILYEIIYNVGFDTTNTEITKNELFLYLQEAFKITVQRHSKLLEIAEKRGAPEILLNVEVIEAKDLKDRDLKGLRDSFVNLFLMSNQANSFKTTVKNATLNPVWEEPFVLPVQTIESDDILFLEVWDFDPTETVKEKLGKIKEIKGVKGMRKLAKEIAVTAATGQHDNKLIGKAKISLSAVPASGLTMWYSLDKKNKMSKQGDVKVRLGFTSKNCQSTSQDYKNLLRILLLHELENSKVAKYWWSGTFTGCANALLAQHVTQSTLQPVDVALAQWAVYITIHQSHPLSFNLFLSLLDKLIKLQACNVRIFWDSLRKLLPSLFSTVRKIRTKFPDEKVALKQMIDVVKILAKIRSLEVPQGTNLFPDKLYSWCLDEPHLDLNSVLKHSVKFGANNWFNHILETNSNQLKPTLQNFIKIIQLLRADILKAEVYNPSFQENLQIFYTKALYEVYQEQIAKFVEPLVTETCKSLKRLSYTAYTPPEEDSEEPLTIGTSLFELYLDLQKFVILGADLCPDQSFKIKNFHSWFNEGVTQWLDIAVFKAMTRIEKAVELDSLAPVDSNVKYSSSAVDALTIFYQIKVFWQQLNWPDVESSYTFIAKIIDDICQCSVFYADKMSDRVDAMTALEKREKEFVVTREWCLAINNIDYMTQNLPQFAEELGKDKVIRNISEFKNLGEAERCKQTLDNELQNAVDSVKNKIIDLLEVVCRKMCATMKQLLVEGAEHYHQDNNSIDKVMVYVDNNLATLHNELNEDNFHKTLYIIWDNLSDILKDLLQTNLERRTPPIFFANLQETLKIMMSSFRTKDGYYPELEKIQHLLKLNGLETPELIHQVHLDLYEDQLKISNSHLGQLTVQLKFQNNDLRVHVMNARNLASKGACDSFVRIHLLPQTKFAGINLPKTKTHKKNKFPLYEEKFDIVLSAEHHNIKDALVLFRVKNYERKGYNNQYIGEAFIPFKNIQRSLAPVESLQQMTLELTKPTALATPALEALEHRQSDKLAKDFLKKYKQRISNR